MRRSAIIAALAVASWGARAQDAGEVVGEAVVRNQRPRRELTRVTVDQSEIARAPGSLGDALRALQNLPGMARAPFLSGSLIVRGAAPSDTLVTAEGTFLPAAYHFGGLQSTVATEVLDRIDFYPGNFSARFGRATGGIVDIGLREPLREGARTVLHLGVLDAGAFNEVALSRTLSVASSARFGWLGYLASPIVAAATGSSTFVSFWDYQALIDWRPNARDRVRVAVLGDGDSLGFREADSGDSTGLGLGYHIVNALWTRRFSPRVELSTALSAGWNGLTVRSENVRRRGGLELTTLSLDSVPLHVRSELTLRASRRATVHLGFDGLFGARTFRSSFPRERDGGDGGEGIPRDATLAIAQPAVYAEAVLSPTSALRVRPGLRLDVSSGTAILSPRVNVDVTAWRGGLLKFAVGYFTQPPLAERVTIVPELLFLANRVARDAGATRPERAVHLGAGVEHRFSPWVSLSVEGFWKSITDAMVGFPSLDLAIAGEDIERAGAVRYDGRGRAYGLELLLRHRQGRRFMGWVAYTLMRAERTDGPGTPWRPFEFDQTHILTAVGSVRLGAGWELGARFRYVTGRPTALGREVFDTRSGGAVQIAPLPWQDRVPDFHQLDLRVEKQWVRSWGRLAFHLEILNVYNRANAERVRWDVDRSSYLPTGAYVPIVPNLGVRGEF